MLIGKNNKLLMIGDSITDSGRQQPVAEGLFDPLGRGYVNLAAALLNAAYPERRLRVVNMGNSGNTVRDLARRWQTDVLNLKPDWVSIMIGINDVWRQFDLPNIPEQHVGLAEYEKTLEKLIRDTLPAVKGIVLMTPYFIEPNKSDPMRRMMDEYGQAVKKLAQKHKTRFADTQKAFDAVLTHCHPMALAWDRVHPNQNGHMVIARAFLQAVEFAWE